MKGSPIQMVMEMTLSIHQQAQASIAKRSPNAGYAKRTCHRREVRDVEGRGGRQTHDSVSNGRESHCERSQEERLHAVVHHERPYLGPDGIASDGPVANSSVGTHRSHGAQPT
jgi:hypothetical protein